MITASLNVERSQIESSRPWRSEQEIAYVIDDEGVELLCLLRGQATQERLLSIAAKGITGLDR